MTYEAQERWRKSAEDKGWGRVSALLEPEYVALVGRLKDRHKGTAGVLRAALVLLAAEAGEEAPSPSTASPGTHTPESPERLA
jgi:hypothetical protein